MTASEVEAKREQVEQELARIRRASTQKLDDDSKLLMLKTKLISAEQMAAIIGDDDEDAA